MLLKINYLRKVNNLLQYWAKIQKNSLKSNYTLEKLHFWGKLSIKN